MKTMEERFKLSKNKSAFLKKKKRKPKFFSFINSLGIYTRIVSMNWDILMSRIFNFIWLTPMARTSGHPFCSFFPRNGPERVIPRPFLSPRKEEPPWEKDELPFGYGNFQFQKQIWYESENWRIFNFPFALYLNKGKVRIYHSILDTKVKCLNFLRKSKKELEIQKNLGNFLILRIHYLKIFNFYKNTLNWKFKNDSCWNSLGIRRIKNSTNFSNSRREFRHA